MKEFQKVFQSEAFGVTAHQQINQTKKSTLLQVNISFLHKHQRKYLLESFKHMTLDRE